jgi:hypothetical protein
MFRGPAILLLGLIVAGCVNTVPLEESYAHPSEPLVYGSYFHWGRMTRAEFVGYAMRQLPAAQDDITAP